MSKELEKSSSNMLPGVSEVVSEIQKIDQVYNAIMKVDIHYGKIPGVKKDILLKAGAEKLAQLFRVTPKYEIFERVLDGGHREYRVTCHLLKDQVEAGEGVGLCTTMESKYRYRSEQISTPLDMKVPKDYWDKKKSGASKEAIAAILGGPGRTVKKIDDNWTVVQVTGSGEKVENPDISDLYNTVLKMAKKRAYVDAVISLSACSDIFDQDLDDMFGLNDAHAPQQAQPISQEAPVVSNQEKSEAVEVKATVVKSSGDDLRALIIEKSKEFELSPADVRGIITKLFPEAMGTHGIKSDALDEVKTSKIIQEMQAIKGGLF